MDNCYRQNRYQPRRPRENVCEEPKAPMCNRPDMDKFPVGMAYVPWQHWNEQYDLQKGLKRGTIFPELDLPFMGMRGGKG